MALYQWRRLWASGRLGQQTSHNRRSGDQPQLPVFKRALNQREAGLGPSRGVASLVGAKPGLDRLRVSRDRIRKQHAAEDHAGFVPAVNEFGHYEHKTDTPTALLTSGQ